MLASQSQIETLQQLYLVFCDENVSYDEFLGCAESDLTHDRVKKIMKNLYGTRKMRPNLDRLVYTVDIIEPNYSTGVQYVYTDKSHTNLVRSLKYISFTQLMVIDYDAPKSDLSKIVETLSDTVATWLVYETMNGFHAYNITYKFDSANDDDLDYMISLGCDESYVAFCKFVGFVVKTEKKFETDEYVEKFVCQVNDYEIDSELKELVRIKDEQIFSRPIK